MPKLLLFLFSAIVETTFFVDTESPKYAETCTQKNRQFLAKPPSWAPSLVSFPPHFTKASPGPPRPPHGLKFDIGS